MSKAFDIEVKLNITATQNPDRPPTMAGEMVTKFSGQTVDVSTLDRNMLDIFMAWHTAILGDPEAVLNRQQRRR